MSKRLILVLTFAFVVGIACAAYAEVQNIKVSGDMTGITTSRQMFGLGGSTSVSGNKKSDTENLLLSQVRVRIDADLTDNVMATVRLLNERNWDSETNSNTDIDLDLAYVTIKELLYSPLSVSVGRQELKFGNGLIIGNARNYAAGATSPLNGVPSDLTVRKAFDAMTATLNYDPLVITGMYAKIDGGTRTITNAAGTTSTENLNTDLWGINASYDLGRRNTKVDAYFYNRNGNGTGNTATTDKSVTTRTVGALLSTAPIEDLKASLEGAYQFGNASGASPKRTAYAVQAMADYTLSKVKFTPAIGASYTYLSGDKDSTDNKNKAWDAMYYDQALNSIAYAILPFSNLQVVNLRGSMKPKDDITLGVNYGYYRLAQKTSSLTSTNFDSNGNTYTYLMDSDKKDLGNEVDLTATYDYTEDVQFGLSAGWFKPSKAFAEQNRTDATQFIGSMKVTF